MELEQSRAGFEKQGIKVASITYDSGEVLRRFAEAHKIGYPMLSDQGSIVIRKFGILNANIPEGHPFYGIPFPGDYLLSADRIIQAKYFLPDYQTRVASSEILLDKFGTLADAKSVSVSAGDLQVAIGLSAGHAAAGHEIGVAADFSIAPGWHIYGEPLAANYTPTAMLFDSDVTASQSFQFPKPEPVRFESLGETLPVYKGTFRASGKLLLRSGLKPGGYSLKGKLKFQECSDQICKIPESVAFEIPFTIDPMAAPAPK